MEDERDAEDKESEGPEAAKKNLSLNAPDSQTILSQEIRSDKQKHAADLQSANSIILVEQNGQALQFDRVVILAGQDGQLYSVPSFPLGGAQMLLPHGQLVDVAKSSGAFVEDSIKSIKDKEDVGSCVVTAASAAAQSSTNEKTPAKRPSPACEPQPPAAPKWSLRLRGCEKIGDSYRGYCNTEAELEAVLLLHKQQTNAVFGTRQSPCSAKTASRLMWKSQYVPYDGIPFVNAGSRAIVMECQFGPRRKGFQPKKGLELETSQNVHYRATCPARIYIKKVQKFPEYKVPTDPTVDKKVVRQEQEKAFFNLKKSLWDVGGVVRYYVQLPTEKAHLYHDLDTLDLPPLPEQISSADDLQRAEEELDTGDLQDVLSEDVTSPSSRLDPRVAEKISELVSLGHDQVYAVRKQLRHYVEREMFTSDDVPDRHNLCYFPTINDIKNHIHEAQKAFHLTEAPASTSQSEWRADQDLMDTVTLTLTPASVDAGSALKDGVLEENSAAEAVQLFTSLSSLQPKTFAHLQAVQLPASMCGVEGSSQHALTNTQPQNLLVPAAQQPVLLSPSTFLVSGQSPAPCGTAALLGMTSEGSDTPACATQISLQAEQALLIESEDPATEVRTSTTHPD